MKPFYKFDFQLPLGAFDLHLKCQSQATMLGLFGASGCGKSSSLKAIAGLHKAFGTIRCGSHVLLDSNLGIDLDPAERAIGYVPQNHCLFPHWNVKRNLLAGQRPGHCDALARKQRFEEAVAILELAPLLTRRIHQLSGGERQRIALGRALCAMPDLLLLDEPMASLDASLKQRILPFLLRVREELGMPMIIVSHNPIELQLLCEEVIVVERGQATTQGSPLEVFTQAQIYPGIATAFENILELNIIEQNPEQTLACLQDANPAQPIVLAPIPGPSRSHIRIGLAASDLLIALTPPVGISARNIIACRINRIQNLPTACLVIVQLQTTTPTEIAAELTSSAVQELGLTPGMDTYIVFKSNAARLYL
ncbi:ATP-binding cassette domain-containing protein [Coraliomargarita sp. SDUM461004]|uniref:ATP-binding cassette domain-containing protein n=1 Tax=Thalassobacterium sedimentorum TaxID=3041258 RepID=A0ABU1AG31_9BACT|nr:ATP-binding cassette domain-containing protein [Coraliomargarita sp. SDUM461004]MDQ8193738.1 ATP-binding cassette domain-containing protein [Coraliomargarita sp. SDUM461004]